MAELAVQKEGQGKQGSGGGDQRIEGRTRRLSRRLVRRCDTTSDGRSCLVVPAA